MVERRTSAMVEGALLAALTALLALIGIYLPPLALLTNLVWTIPLVVLIVRHDLRTGVMATVISGLLVMMLSEPVTALFIFLQFGALGLVYGYFFKHRVSAGKAVFLGTVVAAIFMLFTLLLSVFLMGAPLQNFSEQLHQVVNETMDIYQKTGLLSSFEQQGLTEEELRENLENMTTLLVSLIPGILIISSIISAFLNYILARWVLIRLNYTVPNLPPFREWQLPPYTVWGLIGALAVMLLGDYRDIPMAKTIGQNILYIYLPLLLATGLSIVIFYNHKWNISPLVKGLLLFVAVINLPLVLAFIILLGSFDPLVDYRRLKTSSKGE